MLWRASAATLGMFPDGAFDEYAKKGTILVAADQCNHCVGYLLYRRTRRHVAIAHLCVSKEARGKGVASRLLQSLVVHVDGAAGISVKCRKDFDANGLWPRLGFQHVGEVPGRGKDQRPVVKWWRPLREETLFSHAATELLETKIPVVLDANVLFDLDDDEDRCLASQALLADWLLDQLELFVTGEIGHEIDRGGDPARKARSRARASSFLELPCDMKRFDELRIELQPLFPPVMTDQDRSDLHQLARAIAGDAEYMVTRDGGLLGIARQVEEQYGLAILHPTDLILRLDELRDESKYQPSRFKGSEIKIRRLRGDDLGSLDPRFVIRPHENERTLQRRLQSFASKPDQYDCTLIHEGTEPRALLVVERSTSSDELVVPLLRIRSDHLVGTWWRQLVRHCVVLAAQAKYRVIRITDTINGDGAMSALDEAGFFPCDNGWAKVNLYSVMSTAEAAAELTRVAASYADVRRSVMPSGDRSVRIEAEDPEAASELEHRFWPVKLADTQIPCWIIPINVEWAAELFDEPLANQKLFGRRSDLAVNAEAVYYRSSHGPIPKAPARLLWYVKQGDGAAGSKAIRACSRLVESSCGPPKELYRRFRRLGIYAWSQVVETAGGDLDEVINALRFTDTELFGSPIPFVEANNILEQFGRPRNQFQGPVQITSDLFMFMYKAATVR